MSEMSNHTGIFRLECVAMKADSNRYFPMATAAECPASIHWLVVANVVYWVVLEHSGAGKYV